MEKEPQIQHPRVKLGTQGLVVSRLGFGCAGLTGVFNAPLPHEDGCSVIKVAFNRGITFFDTSDAYGENHDNEIMLGKALKQLPRDQIQVSTKFGVIKYESEGRRVFEIKGTAEHVRASCEASLKRLGVDYIDLYFQHRVDTSVPIEETIGELKKLVEEGKIKYIGLSEASVDTIKRAHKVHPITALQMEYSLWTREIEDEILPLCRELGIGMVAYSPLGKGFFGGKVVVEPMPNGSQLGACLHLEHNSVLCRTDTKGPMIARREQWRANQPRFTGENLEKNKVLYTRLSNLAIKHGCTVPQLALAWLLHQGDDIVPIPGTTKVKNIIDNVGSLSLKLKQEDLKEITDAVPLDEVSGGSDLNILYKYCWKFANTPLK